LPRVWSLAEFERILVAAANQLGEVAGIATSLWRRCPLLVAFDTGLRLGSLLQARVADLDPEAGTLFVAAAQQKQQADQLFTLHADTLAFIAETAPSTAASGSSPGRTTCGN
jgi:integrase